MAWCSNALVVLTGLVRRIKSVSFSTRFRWTGYTVPPKPNFFTEEEVSGLDAELVAKLDWARGRAGIPFIITSGKRTPEQNAAAGGVSDSSHVRGLGVDLRCQNSQDRYKMLNALFLAGFKRIGVYAADGHIHVDSDPSLVQDVFWVKP